MKRLLILILFLCLAPRLFADYNWLEDKRKQIYNYRRDLENYENLIQQKNKVISDIGYRIRDINERIKVLSQLISNMSYGGSKDDLFRQEAEFIFKKESVDRLKEEFKKRIIWLYKHGSDYQAQILFTSESPSIMYARLQYLNKLSQSRKSDFERIKYEEMSLLEKKKINTLNKLEYKKYFAQKREDKDLLLKEKILAEDSLAIAREDVENTGRQIEKIKSRILDLEFAVKQVKKPFIYKFNNTPDYSSDNLDNAKGRLIVPVNSIEIIKDFGRTINPLTGTISLNNGIDVSVAENTEVLCVADGIVESIENVPALRNVIIIKHPGGFTTVYAVLGRILVKKGETVKTGMVIGYSGSTVDNQSFHFEIWKNDSPLDPKSWIRRGIAI
ncbi:MAG TPA: peptidoglycan DD-metalloendopeptidase family protein [Ignavibacteria bacterium]|nr:peptidoglycan DD-metalloendopeptidase family protein [Ignavibacteria bacterium]